MRKVFYLAILVLSTSLFGQKFNQSVFTDLYSLPLSSSASKIFYFYKIPFGSLIFQKRSESYSASVQIAIEVSDSNSNFIQRQFKERNITFDNFDLTVDPEQYIEGIIDFALENRTSIVTSRFVDNNSQKEIFSKVETIPQTKIDSSLFLAPIILNNESIPCDGVTSKVFTNLSGYVPFKNNSYDILIPSIDSTLDKIFVKIISKRDTVFNSKVKSSSLGRMGFAECDGKIILKDDSTSRLTSYFVITGLTPSLKEGAVEIFISSAENYQDKKSFKKVVRWFDKPKSLMDPESAIKFMRFIISDDSIKQILKHGDDYDSLLNIVWKNQDPSPATEYNELMAEYFQRIDYCMMNFSTITGLRGTETDRAKIYVLNGKPNSVERGSNNDGKIFETWTYSKPKKIFIFTDEKGTGEFVLKSLQ